MELFNYPSNKVMVRNNTVNKLKTLTVSVVLGASLSGCLITSPVSNQEFNDTNSQIPIQAWTTQSSKTFRIECTQASHAGLYPWNSSSYEWTTVRTLQSSSTPSYDPKGSAIYSIADKVRIPESCWRRDPTYRRHFTAIRVIGPSPLQSNTERAFNTVDQDGLTCVGRENGLAKSWFGFLTKNCIRTYSNSSTPVTYVRIHTKQD